MGTHQYMISQGGMPYAFQPPTMYSYEDLQLLQQRIPHMVKIIYLIIFKIPNLKL